MAFSERTLLAAKAQSVAGTFEQPLATDWVEATEVTLEPLITDSVDLGLVNAIKGSPIKTLINKRCKLTFSIALAGSGTANAPPWWGVLEKMCGMSQVTGTTPPSVTYATADSGYSMGSLAFWMEGNMHGMHSARGTTSLSISQKGFLVRKYEITGIFVAPSVVGLPAVSITPRKMPIALSANNTTFNLWGFTACLASLNINTNYEVSYNAFLSCTQSVYLMGRKVEGDVEIVMPDLANKNFFALIDNNASSPGSLAFALNATAGSALAINAPKVQLSDYSLGDIDGIRTLKMKLNFLPSLGGDDYSIIQT